MDLIGALITALDTDDARAQAVAGGLMGAVQAAVAQRVGPEAAAKLGAAVPEMAGWQSAADAAASKGGGVGALTSALAGSGAPVQALVGMSQLLSELGLDPAKAMALGSVLFGFLEKRLSPDLLSMVTRALPALSGLGGAAGGGLFGMLGGLMGGQGRH